VRPVPRPEVVRAFWELAAERQRVFFRRLAGDRAPWSEDPILQQYKFCNAYRASDRASQYLIRHVIYEGCQYRAEDQLLRIVLFRLFSRESTWELLEAAAGEISTATFSADRYGVVLDTASAEGQKLYTGAFILCATRAFGYDRKHHNHLALLELMFRPNGLPLAVGRAGSLRELFTALAEYPLIGPFMAYQLAIDINYSELCDFDEDEFTVAGPGAERGIRKCFEHLGGWTNAEVIHWMTARQEAEFAWHEISFQTLWGRRLHAIDIQNLFCELDKYARVRFPDLKSNRSRIKSRFAPTGSLPHPFYPPKWNLLAGRERDDRSGEKQKDGYPEAAQLRLLSI
jgi:hypothetical protein